LGGQLEIRRSVMIRNLLKQYPAKNCQTIVQ